MEKESGEVYDKLVGETAGLSKGWSKHSNCGPVSNLVGQWVRY